MSEYTPDKWVVIEIDYDGVKTQKILSSWYGGWAGSDSWRLSSGITEVLTSSGMNQVQSIPVTGVVMGCLLIQPAFWKTLRNRLL